MKNRVIKVLNRVKTMVARVCRDPTRWILRFSGSILVKMKFWTQNFDRFWIGTTFFRMSKHQHTCWSHIGRSKFGVQKGSKTWKS